MLVNTYIPDAFGVADRAKHNVGGLDSSQTLIDPGDIPVNVEDLKAKAIMEQEYQEMGMEVDSVSPYLHPANSSGSLTEGVAFSRTMYTHDYVRKNSDY